MADRNPASLTVQMSGEHAGSAENVGAVLTAMDGLFKEVARSMGVDPDAIRLEVGDMRWVCDGCGCERPDDHSSWEKRGGLDYCETCSGAVA